MTTNENVNFSVGREDRIQATIYDFTFPPIESTFIGRESQIHSEHNKSGLWYVYGHFEEDTKELFYIGLGRHNRCNQITRRNKYWHAIKNKHGLIIKIFYFGLSKEDAVNKEKFYIKKYWPKANMTIGGEAGNSEKTRKRVFAYNKDGTYFRSFDSMLEANVFFNRRENDSRISNCIKGRRLSFAGFIWKEEFSSSVSKYKKPKRHNAKKVYRYDLNGNFMECFESMNDFKGGSHSGISVCIDKDYTYHSSFWRSYYSEKIEATKPNAALIKSRKVIDTLTNTIYPSISSAAKYLGCNSRTLRRKLIGETHNNTTFVFV